MSQGTRDFILYILLGILTLYVTRINNIWGVNKGTKKAKVDVKKFKSTQNKRIRYLWLLYRFEWVAKNIGVEPKESTIREYTYRLNRLRWYIGVLNRNIKAIELIGVLKGLQLVGTFIGLLGLLMTKSPLFAVFFIVLLLPSIFILYSDFIINDEDMELEQDFPDLFLLLYSRLIRGAYTRLAPTLEDYITSLDVMYSGKSHKVIRNFVVDLRNNIEIYGDDSIAVHKLREMYRSAMIINFCNLAVQSLNGVDTADKLLAFKVELSQKRMEQMKRRAEYLVEKGRRAVYAIYIILFQFVVLSWIAKLGGTGGSIGKIFGK